MDNNRTAGKVFNLGVSFPDGLGYISKSRFVCYCSLDVTEAGLKSLKTIQVGEFAVCILDIQSLIKGFDEFIKLLLDTSLAGSHNLIVSFLEVSHSGFNVILVLGDYSFEGIREIHDGFRLLFIYLLEFFDLCILITVYKVVLGL